MSGVRVPPGVPLCCVMKTIYLFLYYLIAKKLPASTRPGGTLAKKIRYILCKKIFNKCGIGVNVEYGADFGRGKDIEIGDNSGIGYNARVSGPVKIGKQVMMGPDVMILALSHEYADPNISIGEQGIRKPRQIIIGDGVWIGARAIILPGVKVGMNSIVGAGSVVTKNIPPYSVAAGNPARVVRRRK